MPPQYPTKDSAFFSIELIKANFWYRLLWAMLACELILVILNIWTPEVISRSVHLDRESNFVVWFSSSQLLLACLTALLISMRETAFRARLPWLLLSLLLLLLSIDETAMLHESIGPRLTIHPNDRLSETHWLMQTLPIVIGVLFFLGWLIFYGFRSNLSARRLMIIALLCWITSLTFEGIQRNIDSLPAIFSSSHNYKAAWIIEEFLEMVGASFLWVALGLRLCAESNRVQ